MTTLSYQRGEWGKHFTTSYPKISIVLDHAAAATEATAAEAIVDVATAYNRATMEKEWRENTVFL
jgi:hypothetical protein